MSRPRSTGPLRSIAPWSEFPQTRSLRRRDEGPRRLLLDHDNPRSDERTLWTAPATPAWRRRRRAGGWRRSRTALRLEEVHVVRLWISRDRLRSGECVDRGNRRVRVGRILVDDCNVALAPIW